VCVCVHIDVVIMLECFSIILNNYFFACLLNLVCMCVQVSLESRESVTSVEDEASDKVGNEEQVSLHACICVRITHTQDAC
jgi:hypothetical protein